MRKILSLAFLLIFTLSSRLVAQISGTPVVCVGASTALSDPLPGGSWSSSAPSVALVSVVSGALHGVSAGTATISYVSGSTTHTIVVTVNPLPSAGSISGLSSVCVAGTTTLSATASGGSWSAATGNAGVTGGVITGVSVGLDTIIYTVSNSCGSALVRKPITVNTLPSVGAVSGAPSVCVGASITLTDATPAGVWTVAHGNASVGSTGIVIGIAPGLDTVLYSVTNLCGTSVVSHIITVNPLPSAGVVVGPSAVCIGAAITLSATVSGGTWSASNTSASVVAGTVSGVAAGVDTISYSVTNICGTALAVTIVSVSPVPYAGTLSGAGSLCAAATTTLATTVAGGTWTTTTGAASAVGGVVTGILPGTDTIRYTITTACGTDVAMHPVTVDPLPEAGIITGAAGVCNGASITLSSSGLGGMWFSDDVTTAPVDASGNVDGIAPGFATIHYTVSNSCGADTATFVVSVDNPAAPFTCPAVLCSLDSVEISDATPGGSWSSDNALTASIILGNILLPFLPGTATISYTVTNACGTTTETQDILVILCLPLDNKTVAETQSNLKIYPDPADGNFTFEYIYPVNEKVQAYILDAMGRRVSEFSTRTNKPENINIQVPAGIYTIIAMIHGEKNIARITIN